MKYSELDQYVEYLRSYPRESPKEYLSLDRIKKVLQALGSPEKKLKGVQVGGTNGKGSTCAILESILVEAGYKVGVFLSPHLISYTERFRINKKDISEKKLCSYIEKIKLVVEALEKETGDRLTWFEHLVVAGVLYFVDEKVDIAVFEVGLGGRLDATTCLSLDIKVITNVALDHTQILGNTLTKIALEKAAIVQRNNLVVTAAQNAPLKIIKKRVQKTSARLLVIGKDIDIETKNVSLLGTDFTVTTKIKDIPSNIHLNLIGAVYGENLACALGVVYWLRKKGYKIIIRHILAGAKKVKMAARFQIISKKPLIIIDGGHNPNGIKSLVKTISIIRRPKQKIVIIFSAKENKNAKKMLNLLAKLKAKMIFFETSRDNFYSPDLLRRIYRNGIIVNSLKSALKHAKQLAGNCGMLLVAGSLYSAGDALAFFQKQKRKKLDLILDNQVEQKKIAQEIEIK